MRTAVRRRRKFRFTRRSAVKLLLILPFVLVTGWLVVAVGVASEIRSTRPAEALALAPFDARAYAVAADRIAVGSRGSRAGLAQARQLAQTAVQRDPTLVVGWRTYAVATATQNPDRATRLLRLAERMSRRDLPTQLMLIEERVAANDIPGTLRHYDRALRTSRSAGAILLPVLASATSDAAIIQPLADLLATEPRWRNDLFVRITQSIPEPGNVARLMEAIDRKSPLAPTPEMSGIIGRLVEQGDFDDAWRVRRTLGALGAGDRYVRDGNFESTRSISAFDWALTDDPSFGAERVTGGGIGSGPFLEIRAGPEQAGMVARQLLLLPPGSYRLSAMAGAVPDALPAQLSWTVTCANAQARTLVERDLPPLGPAARREIAFRVPASGCPGQWLSLGVRSNSEPGGAAGWIDDVAIRPAGA